MSLKQNKKKVVCHLLSPRKNINDKTVGPISKMSRVYLLQNIYMVILCTLELISQILSR